MKKHVKFLFNIQITLAIMHLMLLFLFFAFRFNNPIRIILWFILFISTIAILFAVIRYKKIQWKNTGTEMRSSFEKFRFWLTFIPIIGIAGLFLPKARNVIRFLQIGELTDEYLRKVQGFNLRKDPILILFDLLTKIPVMEAMETFELFHKK